MKRFLERVVCDTEGCGRETFKREPCTRCRRDICGDHGNQVTLDTKRGSLCPLCLEVVDKMLRDAGVELKARDGTWSTTTSTTAVGGYLTTKGQSALGSDRIGIG